MAMTIGYFSSMHIPIFLTYIVSYGELFGGVLLVLGLFTEYASTFLIIVMLVALYFTVPQGLQMFMTPVATLAGLISILGNGSGTLALKFYSPYSANPYKGV